MDYRESAEAILSTPGVGQKKPFAYLAASIAFWTPLVSIGLFYILRMALTLVDANGPAMRYVGTGFTVLFVMLGVTAVALGVMGLLGVRKHGRELLLWRSIAGVCMGAGMLAVIVLGLLMAMQTPEAMAQRLAGQWQGKVTLAQREFDFKLSLGADRRGSVTLSGGGRTVSASGPWQVGVNRDTRIFLLSLRFDAGQEPALGAGMQWQVERLEADRLVLLERKADGSLITENLTRISQ